MLDVLAFHVAFSPVVTSETSVPPDTADLLVYVVSVNFAFTGTSLFTVWSLTVDAFPPLAGILVGKSVIWDFVWVWFIAAYTLSALPLI